MRFEFTDLTTGEQLIAVNTPNQEFGMNIFNLFMAEMVRMHGPTFRKLSSEVRNKDENIISLVYTHNIVGDIKP
jgi:hypothetical protein